MRYKKYLKIKKKEYKEIIGRHYCKFPSVDKTIDWVDDEIPNLPCIKCNKKHKQEKEYSYCDYCDYIFNDNDFIFYGDCPDQCPDCYKKEYLSK